MRNTRRNSTRRHAHAVGGSIYSDDRTPREYVRGSSGRTRPEPDDTYLLDGEAHRFDGKCHPDCENVR